MAIQTIKAGGRYYRVVPATGTLPGAPFLEIGPAGTQSQVSTFAIQFKPDALFDGSFTVVARTLGSASDAYDTPFTPIPYRVGSLGDVAQITNGQGWPWSLDPIVGTALIQVPANGMSIALFLQAPTQGQCEITSWDLQGSSSM